MAGEATETGGAEEVEHLFVYGSLAPGRANHAVVGGIDGCWSRGAVRGRLLGCGPAVEAGYPALRLEAEGGQVPGFLLSSAVLSAHWERIDRFEGPWYRRVRTQVLREDGTRVRAWVYEAAAEPEN